MSLPLTLATEDLVLVALLAVPASGIAFVMVRRGEVSRAGAIITMIVLVLGWWAFLTWTSGAGEA